MSVMAETEAQKYEKLGRAVIDSLSKLKGLDNCTVKWNQHPNSKMRKRNGKPFKHQIDVLWEFEVAGKKKRIALEAKNWSEPVDFSNLMRFVGVLGDLEEETKGIIVTRAGFDINVEEYARVRGIGLLILDDVGRTDFVSGNIPEVIVSVKQTQFGINWKSMGFQPLDAEEALDRLLAANLNETELYNEEGKKIGTLTQLLKEQLDWAESNKKLCHHGPVNTEFRVKPVYMQGLEGEKIQILNVASELMEITTELGVERATIDRILQFIVEDELYVVDSKGNVQRADSFHAQFEFDGGTEEQPLKIISAVRIPLAMYKRPSRPPKKSKEKKAATDKDVSETDTVSAPADNVGP